MIDLSINKVGLEHNIQKAKENHIIIPTIAQMQNPDLIPETVSYTHLTPDTGGGGCSPDRDSTAYGWRRWFGRR